MNRIDWPGVSLSDSSAPSESWNHSELVWTFGGMDVVRSSLILVAYQWCTGALVLCFEICPCCRLLIRSMLGWRVTWLSQLRVWVWWPRGPIKVELCRMMCNVLSCLTTHSYHSESLPGCQWNLRTLHSIHRVAYQMESWAKCTSWIRLADQDQFGVNVPSIIRFPSLPSKRGCERERVKTILINLTTVGAGAVF